MPETSGSDLLFWGVEARRLALTPERAAFNSETSTGGSGAMAVRYDGKDPGVIGQNGRYRSLACPSMNPGVACASNASQKISLFG
jgi:hypothetical protein